MKVEKEIADELRGRGDLIKIMDEAAEYLASRDKDVDSRAHVQWKLWSGPDGKPFIGLQIDDEGYSTGRQYTPRQLADPSDQRLGMISIWNDVLRERAWREVRHVNELISQYQGS